MHEKIETNSGVFFTASAEHLDRLSFGMDYFIYLNIVELKLWIMFGGLCRAVLNIVIQKCMWEFLHSTIGARNSRYQSISFVT